LEVHHGDAGIFSFGKDFAGEWIRRGVGTLKRCNSKKAIIGRLRVFFCGSGDRNRPGCWRCCAYLLLERAYLH
jgi:hypothetical protein